LRFRNQKSERELQIQFQIFFFIKEIGGGMASKYFLEERWNNIEGKGGGSDRKSGILMSIDCTNLTVARHLKLKENTEN
jgi:hypothetical protein